MNSNNCPFFDRDTTNLLKGVAIIFMFVSHFFMFPNFWVEGVSYSHENHKLWKMWLGQPLGMCVPIFCFLSGYFYYFNKYKTYRYSWKKISKLLITYWAVLLLFMTFGIFFAGYQYTWTSIVAELFALQRPTMIFCWYVIFYITCMLFLPLAIKPMSKNVHIDIVLSFIIYPAFSLCMHAISKKWDYDIFIYITMWFPVMLAGYIFAKYDLFNKINNRHNQFMKDTCINIIICFLLAASIWICRNTCLEIIITITDHYSIHISMDAVYTAIFIYAVVRLCNLINARWWKNILAQMGKHSMSMWFISCIFFGNSKTVFQPILYYPHHPVLVIIWGLVMCYTAACVIDYIIEGIKRQTIRFITPDS